MKKTRFEACESLLNQELIPALGCTEPIALAYCAAKAREVLDRDISDIEQVDLYCSGNIIKNVKGVTVPRSGGLRGLEIAAAMGITGGNAARGLETLEEISPAQLEAAVTLKESGIIQVHLVEGEENLYIRTEIKAGDDRTLVEIRKDHTHISKIVRNHETLLETAEEKENQKDEADTLSLQLILDFANEIDFNEKPDILAILNRQIGYNLAIAEEGLRNQYGAQVGRTIWESRGDRDAASKAIAYACAGSDARMGGCSLPVVINSGSGNQGMTVSLPVIIYARENHLNEDKLRRALLVANLMAIHQKQYIGRLSAFCGVVSAASGAGTGIGYLKDFSYQQISMVVTNTIAAIGGMVCDGAKSSCAMKIAQALNNVFVAIDMAGKNLSFQYGEGLVGKDVEQTIRNIGRMAKDGMRSTDLEILKIMIE